MIGRLFSSLTHPPAVEGEEQLPNVPVSMLDEADTRNLLYGPANISVKDNRLEANKDIRVVVLTDYKACDAILFDSALEQKNCSPLGLGSTAANPSKDQDQQQHNQQNQQQNNQQNNHHHHHHNLNFKRANPQSASSPISVNGAAALHFDNLLMSRSPLSLGRSTSYFRSGSSSATGSFSGQHQASTAQIKQQQQPTCAGESYVYKYRDSPEVLPYSLLKPTVFGYTTPMFTSPIIKLHPLPTDDTNHNRHLVSLVFKITIANPNFVPSAFNNTSNTPHASSVSSSHSSSILKTNGTSNSAVNGGHGNISLGKHVDETVLESTWQPRSMFSHFKSSNSHSASKAKEGLPQAASLNILCGICIFFNTPKSNPELIQNHWKEVVMALAELYSTLSPKLEAFLAPLRPLPPGPAVYRPRISMSYDRTLSSACDKFIHRIMASVRTPRVLCGQRRWPELLHLLQWAVPRFEGSESDSNFISAMICYFILHNKKLLRQDYDYGSEPPIRTVLIASNRIFARKLLFILTSLIRDSHMDSLLDQELRHRLSTPPPTLPPPTATAQSQRHDSPTTLESSKTESLVSSTSSTSLCSNFPLYNSDQGWEIPSVKGSKAIAEASSPNAVPFMVRSHTSPAQSLSKSLHLSHSRSFLNSIDEMYKSFTSSGGSIFSSISGNMSDSTTDWSSDDGVFDENFIDFDGFLASSSENSPRRPGMSRMSSAERTASSIHTYRDSQTLLSDKEEDDELAVKYTLHFSSSGENVADGDILDVEIENWDDTPQQQQVTLLPVVGHVPEFHPDFIVQACPLAKDLEERISQTMFSDGKIWLNHQKECVQDFESTATPISRVLSKTLIIHLRKREIYEWTLTESKQVGDVGKLFDQLDKAQHRLLQAKIYPSKKSSTDPRNELCRGLTQDLKKLLHLNPTSAAAEQCGASHESDVEALRTAFTNFFGLDISSK